ncbi:DNA mismatch repair protein MutT [Mycoplasmopsis agassizii]|nr:DNA mismatch repair protein MutT [Mycoplasmopsis agassizii]SMC15840.1 hypothetical protein SAMN02745179_00125 [Mycoplasmopsis agassizii]
MKSNKLLFKNKWINVYENEKGFIYCQRKGINSIAALLIRKVADDHEFMIHFQPLPEVVEKKTWDEPYPCPVTGTIEENSSELESLISEVSEEAGFEITEKNIVDSSVFVSSTQMNEKVFSYLIDVTGLKNSEPKTDGSVFESVSFNKWYSHDEFQKIVKSDLVLSSLSSLYLLYLLNYKKW